MNVIQVIRNLAQRPIVRQGIEAVRAARAATGRVVIGDNSGAPNVFQNPAAYAKLIAYAVGAAATLAARWWGVDVSVELQSILVELFVSIIGGWAVWRVPNRPATPAGAPE